MSIDRRGFIANLGGLALLASLPAMPTSTPHKRKRFNRRDLRLGCFKATNQLMDNIPGTGCYRRLYQNLTEDEYHAVLDQLNTALLMPDNAIIYDASPHCFFMENCTAFRVQCDDFPKIPEGCLLHLVGPTYRRGEDGKVAFAGWGT